jgi:Cdc6-like AAA superfamily ATPase
MNTKVFFGHFHRRLEDLITKAQLKLKKKVEKQVNSNESEQHNSKKSFQKLAWIYRMLSTSRFHMNCNKYPRIFVVSLNELINQFDNQSFYLNLRNFAKL